MVEENKNKITIDLIKKMNEKSHRPKRIYEEPIIEIKDEEVIDEEEVIKEEKKTKPKKEIGILQLIMFHVFLIIIILVFVALN